MRETVELIECPRDAWQGLADFIPTNYKAEYLKELRQLLELGRDDPPIGLCACVAEDLLVPCSAPLGIAVKATPATRVDPPAKALTATPHRRLPAPSRE